ncbi:MAG: leucine-rich repeat protein [Oscillospiraceae bacterium]|nr:leucine-rich repeat protein [Oscillospiraceae bacterium]
MDHGLFLEYTLHADGAHLVRVLGDTPCPALPDEVDGVPITQLGAYAFSASQHKIRPGGEVHTACIGEPPASAQPLCGSFLEQVRLPAGLQVMGNAAFYDCRRLEAVTLGPAIRSVGSDLFTNCRCLARFTVLAAPGDVTGLRPVLGTVQNDLRLTFEPAGEVLAALHYPEFWEELEENAPAHLFNRGIHGRGYHYRQCFARGVVDYAEYDSVFEVALAEEDPAMLAALALDRLRWPWALSETARTRYTEYLRRDPARAAEPLIRADDAEGLRALCGLGVFTRESLAAAERIAQAAERPQAMAVLTAHRRTAFGVKKKTYSFD